MTWPVHGRISGPIVLVGFGSIGRVLFPEDLDETDPWQFGNVIVR